MKAFLHNNFFRQVVAVCASLLLAAGVSADTLYVTNIFEFIDALRVSETNGADDTILLEATNYYVGDLLGTNLVYKAGSAPPEDYSITIKGTNGTPVLQAGYTQGLKIDTKVPSESQANAHVVVDGIRIENGHTSDYLNPGGGLHVWTQNSDITVKNCSFITNSASHIFNEPDGAGLYVKAAGGDITVSNNVFIGNDADGDGGGMMMIGGANVLLADNTFIANITWGNADFAGGGGGAAFISGPDNLTIVNNTFIGNTNSGAQALCGGGALYIKNYLDSSITTIQSNMFWGNGVNLGEGGDVFLENDGNGNGTGAVVTVENNNIANLEFETASNVTTQENTSIDPILIDYGDGPAPDTDSDGMPDAWEWSGGLDPNNASGDDGISGNPDGDIHTNLQEYVAGTNPRDPMSIFRVESIGNVSNATTFSFMSVTGRFYRVEGRQEITNGTWSVAVSNMVGTGQLLSIEATNGPSYYYYRANVSLTPWN